MTEIEDAAFRYVNAWRNCVDADRLDVQTICERDMALHDLVTICGYPCDCEPDTCPEPYAGLRNAHFWLPPPRPVEDTRPL